MEEWVGKHPKSSAARTEFRAHRDLADGAGHAIAIPARRNVARV